MFERFTDQSRRAVVLAQEEARRLGHDYIGTEHLLAGLRLEERGAAAQALKSAGVSRDAILQEIETIAGQGPEPGAGQGHPSGHIPFTPQAKKVLELSLRESMQLGHEYIGTEHILLALAREGEGVAAQVLTALGAGEEQIRAKVIQTLTRAEPRPGPRSGEARFFGASPQLREVITRLRAIENRLAAIERQLGVPPVERTAGAPEPGDGPEEPGDPGTAAAE